MKSWTTFVVMRLPAEPQHPGQMLNIAIRAGQSGDVRSKVGQVTSGIPFLPSPLVSRLVGELG